jgi:hypothetical protein
VGQSLIDSRNLHTKVCTIQTEKTEKNPNNTQTSSNSEKLRLGLVLNSKEFREL